MDAVEGVREWVSAGRRGEEGSVGRVFGARKGTCRNVDPLRDAAMCLSEVGETEAEVEGPARGRGLATLFPFEAGEEIWTDDGEETVTGDTFAGEDGIEVDDGEGSPAGIGAPAAILMEWGRGAAIADAGLGIGEKSTDLPFGRRSRAGASR